MKGLQTVFDKTAISLSFLCIAHCLLLPVALTVFPVLLSLSLGDEMFHKMLVLAVIPTSLIGLTMGCKKHQRWSVFAWGGSGLAIVLFAVLFGHDVLGEVGEKLFTLVGSLVIAWGHFQNYRLCRSGDCHEH